MSNNLHAQTQHIFETCTQHRRSSIDFILFRAETASKQ